MALQERSGDFSAAASAPPGDPHTRWVELGRVVYSWADRRDPAVDRAWWRMRGALLYDPEVLKVRTGRDPLFPEGTRA